MSAVSPRLKRARPGPASDRTHDLRGPPSGDGGGVDALVGGYFVLTPRCVRALFTQSLRDTVSKGTASRAGYFFSK